MKFKTLLYTLLILATIQLQAQTTLVQYGSSWKYNDLGVEPAPDAGLEWEASLYNDSSWPTGNAHLGYGDGDETTTVNSSINTCYVRHAFNVTDAAAFGNIDLNLTYDDGAVVYLNGIEVWRVNMPTGTISYGTFSSTTSSENAQISLNTANTLLTGTNVVAVEIHQRSSTSSDISFDFELVGNPVGLVSVVRGPYLQKASPTNMTVK